MIDVPPECDWRLVPTEIVTLLNLVNERYSFVCAACKSAVTVPFEWEFAGLVAPAEPFTAEALTLLGIKYGRDFTSACCAICATLYLVRAKGVDRSYGNLCVTVETVWKVGILR